MTRLPAFLLCLSLVTTPANALVNGEKVSDEQFTAEYPWMVAVVGKQSGGVCGGVLIAPNWVLTAAHCVNRNKYVVAGTADRTKAKRYDVERPIRHPDFAKETLQYDLGLLKLKEPVDAPLAPLATRVEAMELLEEGVKGTLLGWGRIERRSGAVSRLRAGPVRLDKLTLAGTQIRYIYRGGGPCGRDSGGPMLLAAADGSVRVVGVASATDGELCVKNGGGAVYTNIARARSFLEKHIQGF